MLNKIIIVKQVILFTVRCLLIIFLLTISLQLFSQKNRKNANDTNQICFSDTNYFSWTPYYYKTVWVKPISYEDFSWTLSFRKNIPDGKYKVFHPNNELIECPILLCAFKDRKPSGSWKLYYPNGQLCKTNTYENGLPVGESKTYNHLGELYAISNYNGLIQTIEYTGADLYSHLGFSMENFTFRLNKKKGYEVYDYSKLIKCDITNYVDYEPDYNFEMRFVLDSNKLSYYYYRNGQEYPYSNGRDIKNIFRIEIGESRLCINFYCDYDEYPDTNEKYNIVKNINFASKCLNLREFNLYSYKGDKNDSIAIDSCLQSLNLDCLTQLESIKLRCYLSKIPPFVYKCKNLKSLEVNSPENSWDNEKIDSLTSLETLKIFGGTDASADRLILKIYKLPKLEALSLSYKTDYQNVKNLKKLNNIKQLILDTRYSYMGKIDRSVTSLPNDIYKLKNLVYFSFNPYVCADKLFKHLPNCFYGRFGDGCLVSGTQIAQPNNSTKPIEQLQVGDIVLAYDTVFGRIDTSKVIKTFIHDNSQQCIEIRAQLKDTSTSIIATPNHPVFVSTTVVKRADEIKVRDKILYLDKYNNMKEVIVSAIVLKEENYDKVYNIETTKHNYFANGVLVHNK